MHFKETTSCFTVKLKKTETVFTKPKDQSESKRKTNVSNSNLLKLWQMAVNVSDRVVRFGFAYKTPLKLSSIPSQPSRHLNSHWLSLLRPELKDQKSFLKRLEKFHLGWTGGLLALLPESGHHGRTRQRPELFEHRHNSGMGDHLWSFGNFVILGDFYYLGWLHRTASWRGVFPHRSSTSSSTCQLI